MFFFKDMRDDLNQKNGESAIQWAVRVQNQISEEIAETRKKGNSINKIILLMPPKFLERIYAVTFACSQEEAKRVIFEERKKNGFISLFGISTISNASVLYPEIHVLGDLRQMQQEARLQAKKMFGGKVIRF